MDLFVTLQGERIKELREEFSDFVNQYGCNCGHPYCTPCRDTKDAWKIINKSNISTANQ